MKSLLAARNAFFRLRRRVRRGMTLIELMIAMTILLVLGGIAFAVLGNSGGDAYQAAMETDLRNLPAPMDRHFRRYHQYPDSLASVETSPTETAAIMPFEFSQDVSIHISNKSQRGYTAVATHKNRTSMTCTLLASANVGSRPRCVDTDSTSTS